MAAAEFAALLPFLAFVFVVVLDFGRIFYYTVTIDNCVHNGAMYASQSFDNQNQQWISGDTQYWQGSSSQVSSVQQAMLADGANLNPAVAPANIPTPTTSTDTAGNSYVTVSVQNYSFPMITLFPTLPANMTISRSCTVRAAPAKPTGD